MSRLRVIARGVSAAKNSRQSAREAPRDRRPRARATGGGGNRDRPAREAGVDRLPLTGESPRTRGSRLAAARHVVLVEVSAHDSHVAQRSSSGVPRPPPRRARGSGTRADSPRVEQIRRVCAPPAPPRFASAPRFSPPGTRAERAARQGPGRGSCRVELRTARAKSRRASTPPRGHCEARHAGAGARPRPRDSAARRRGRASDHYDVRYPRAEPLGEPVPHRVFARARHHRQQALRPSASSATGLVQRDDRHGPTQVQVSTTPRGPSGAAVRGREPSWSAARVGVLATARWRARGPRAAERPTGGGP